MDTHELAWAAGFFDGEGYVGAGLGSSKSARRPWGRIRIILGQGHREILDRWIRAVGVGKVLGPRFDQNINGKPMWRVEVGARATVHQVCWVLWPWLDTVKRQQFHNAFVKYHAIGVAAREEGESDGQIRR